MICVSIAGLPFQQCRDVLKEAQMAEIRLDLLDFSPSQVQEIFSTPIPLIATFRPGKVSEEFRRETLENAIKAGAKYVDLEIESDTPFKEAVIAHCRRHDCRVIVSYHNYENTPSAGELASIIDRCFDDGADVAKVACQVHTGAEAARLLALYDHPGPRNENKQLVALGMGAKAVITRVAAPLLGAPFTYAAPASGNETAPGQLDKDRLEAIYQRMIP